MLFSEAVESRRLVRAGAEGLSELIPESVLPTLLLVVEPGCPRYGLGLVRVREGSPFRGGKQGGTANQNSSLRSDA